MTPLKIRLVVLGNLKHAIDFDAIEKWGSKIFAVECTEHIQALPDSEGPNWEYLDSQLNPLVVHENSFDLTIGIINARLEQNYYLRRLGNKVGVLSLLETADILQAYHLSLESFILRNLYEICCAYLFCSRNLPIGVYDLPHDETRACLFDMAANKVDIVFSTARPILCSQCMAKLQQAQLNKEFLPTLQAELKRIKKKLFYRIFSFIEAHPIFSLIITALTGIILNIIANMIYDVLKGFLK